MKYSHEMFKLVQFDQLPKQLSFQLCGYYVIKGGKIKPNIISNFPPHKKKKRGRKKDDVEFGQKESKYSQLISQIKQVLST